jgi:hypothetical protein
MLRSQPLFGFESQLLKPVLHTGVQPLLVLQLVVPFPFVHASPHERQLLVVPSAVSQLPFESQSAVVASHMVGTQVPVTHDSPEPPISHGLPHVPQSVSVRSEVSQPFDAFMSQASQPVLQV